MEKTPRRGPHAQAARDKCPATIQSESTPLLDGGCHLAHRGHYQALAVAMQMNCDKLVASVSWFRRERGSSVILLTVKCAPGPPDVTGRCCIIRSFGSYGSLPRNYLPLPNGFCLDERVLDLCNPLGMQ